MSDGSAATSERPPSEPLTTPEGEEKQVEQVASPRRDTRFTPESARKAALRRAEVVRERNERAAEELASQRLTARQRLGLALSKLSQDDLDAVITQLAADAKKGDTKAIHALARLLDQSFGRAVPEAAPSKEEALDWAAMSPAQQSAYLAALVHEREQAIAELEGIEQATTASEKAAGDAREPSQGSDESGHPPSMGLRPL